MLCCCSINIDDANVQGTIYENDEIIFSTECVKRIQFDASETSVLVKIAYNTVSLSWDEVHVFTLDKNKTYSFIKEQCKN